MRLELRGITKRFPSVVANDDVSFDVQEGEVHALLGENGAGKTTLMNVLYGLYHADEGEILIDGKPVTFSTPRDAINAGIGMVHQHFMLVPVFTVTENVMLGVEEAGPFGLLDQRKARRAVREISERFGFDVPPDALVEELPVGVQQRVEILKALYRRAQVLILDEPTAVLTPQETAELFRVLRLLQQEFQTSIVFISHKLKEVLEVADRITVLRRGRVAGTTTPAETSEEQLASMMVGRDVSLTVDRGSASPGEAVLRLEGVTVLDDRGQAAVHGIDLQVRAGEILGVAGVQGNGQTELVEGLTGLRDIDAGSALFNGHDLTHASPRKVTEAGVAHIPEDRTRDGLVLDFSVADNLVLSTYYVPPFARGPSRDFEAVSRAAGERIENFDIRTPSPLLPAGNLSGGNQQKVIVARELSRPVRLVIASQPTRGLDVGSISYIHERLIEARDQGTGVLLVSPELDEVMALSDRIAIMYRGRIQAIVEAGAATREEIGLLMAGASVDEARRRRDEGDA